jgi:hypothetical protein
MAEADVETVQCEADQYEAVKRPDREESRWRST